MNYQNEMKSAYPSGYGQAPTVQPTAVYSDRLEAPPTQPRFEQIADSFGGVPNDLYKAVMRIRTLADRYGGSVPEPVGKAGQNAEPTSLAARLEASASAIHELIGQLHSQIDRLERF